MRFTPFSALLLVSLVLPTSAQEAPTELDKDRKPTLVTHGNCLIRNGTLLTVTGGILKNTDILVMNGKIAKIGANLPVPQDSFPVINASGRFVTPGFVDAHSHVAIDGVNEFSDSITADVRIHDVLNPQSLSLYRGLSSGVTSSLLLHGSANAIGGQSVVVKMKYQKTATEMIIADAPRMIKFALGENVTSRGGRGVEAGRFPATRMGVEAVYRRAFTEARNYMALWDTYNKVKATQSDLVAPRRDLRLETIAGILKREIWVHCHSYREDEMLMMVRLSQEFGFKLAALQHALEAYKIAPEIAKAGVGVSTFAGDWAYKIEAYDAISYNAALCLRAGIVTSVNSDNSEGNYHLNLEAAKSIRYGGLNENEALRLITINPAIQLGIDRHAGSLEVGKDADIAVWQGHPFSTESKCVLTMVEGETMFTRRDAFGVDKTSLTRNTVPLPAIDPAELTPLPIAKTYAIVGGTVHPVSGADILNGTVVISEGKIISVGLGVQVPSGAVIVNAKSKHVYPGLMDAGSQLGLQEIGQANVTNDNAEGGEFQPDLLAYTAVHPASEHFPVSRVAGISLTQTYPDGGVVSGQGAVLEMSGWTVEEMTVRKRAALHVRFPEGLSEETIELLGQFLPPEDVQKRVEASKENQTRIKDLFAGAKQYLARRMAAPLQTLLDLRWEAMRPYMEGKLPVIFHANTPKGIRGAIALAEEYKLKPILADGREAWRVADFLSKKKIPLIYTVPISNSLGGADIKEYDPYDTGFAGVSVLLKAGVKVAFQSSDAAMVKNLPGQVGFLRAFGVSDKDALRGLTLTAAEILGVDGEVGSLTPGKRADVIITDGDPLELTTRVERMFVAGKPVPMTSKHSALYLKYRKRL